jgi:hypothetical protein
MKENGEILTGILERALELGEVPYQANRRALRAFDVLGDRDKGLRELNIVVNGIDIFVRELEGFENAARDVARNAVAAIS